MKFRVLSFCVFVLFIANIPCLFAQTADSQNLAASPPKFLNFVHEELKPGSASAYGTLETSIVRSYNAAHANVYWLCLQAITGHSEILYLNFFNSFEEYENIFATFGEALAAHPELIQMQARLQQENVSREKTVIGVRRDDVGYRVNAIDFSKMHRLRIHEFRVRLGHESEFVEFAKMASAAYEKTNSDIPWVVYQVDSGQTGPTFLVLLPMRSLNDWDNTIAGSRALAEALEEIGGDRLRQIGLDAISSTENHVFIVSPEMSHMWKEFAAGDPDFWTPKPAAATKSRAETIGARDPGKSADKTEKKPQE